MADDFLHDLNILREKAREDIAAGKLPSRERMQFLSDQNDPEYISKAAVLELEYQQEELLSIKDLLENSLLKYEQNFELAPSAFFVLNKLGSIVRTNKKAEKLLKLSKTQLIGSQFSTFLVEEDEAEFNNFWSNLNSGESQQGMLLRLKEASGSLKKVIIDSAIFQSENPNDTYVCLTLTDVSYIEIHGASTRTRETEFSKTKHDDLGSLLDCFAEYAFDAFIILDLSGHVTSCNSSAARMFGCKRNELIGKHISDTFTFHNTKELELLSSIAQTGNAIDSFETKRLTLKGETFHAEVRMAPIFDLNNENANNQIIGIVQIIRDIPPDERAENVAHDSEDSFKMLFDESEDMQLIVSLSDGRILHSNKTAKAYLKQYKRDINHKHVSVISGVEFDWDSFLDKLKAENTLRDTLSIHTSEDERIVFDVSARSITWSAQSAAVIKMLDVTNYLREYDKISKLNEELEQHAEYKTSELKEAMHELEVEIYIRKKFGEKLIEAKNRITEAYQKEKELNEFKSDIIATISHEYRTPLAVIFSSAEFLETYFDKLDKEKFLRHLDKIKNSIDSLVSLIDDVLMYGKIESGKIKTNFEEIDLIALIDKLITEHNLIDASRHRISLISEGEEQLIYSDYTLLRHSLSNLLSNAIKYSAEGTKIEIHIEESESELIISFKDEGIGIEPSEISRVFESFYRGSNVESVSGTGFGLSIVRGCLESLGGEITVNSQLGAGSEFIVKLPKNINILGKE